MIPIDEEFDLQTIGNDSLLLAIVENDYEGARDLIQAGANPQQHNDLPICLAAAEGHTQIVALLLQHGADYSVHDHKPLREAEANGHTETAQLLRAAGSHNPFFHEEFVRSVADRVARKECIKGSNEPFEEIRNRVLRIFDIRRDLKSPKP